MASDLHAPASIGVRISDSSLLSSHDTTTDSLETNPNLSLLHEKPTEQEPGRWADILTFTRMRHVPLLVFAIICTVISAALKTVSSVFMGLLFQTVTDYGSGSLESEKALAEVVKWCLVLCAVAAGTGLSDMAVLSSWTVFGTLQAEEIRSRMFGELLNREMDWFDTRQDGISSMLVRIRTQTREFQTMATYSFGYVISDTLTLIFSIILGFIFSWKLTLVMLSTVPASAIALNLITRKLEPAVESQKACLAEASKYTASSLGAVDIVKVYTGFDHEIWQYLASIRKAAMHYRTQARCNSGQKAYVKFWIIGLFSGGFTFGIFLLNHGAQAGSILTAFYATLSGLTAVEGILPAYLVLSKGISASRWLKKTIEGVDDGKKVLHMAGKAWPPRCSGAIQFNAASFAYPSNPTKTILYPSSFSFPPGQLAFIVGKSGSGKSTIGNLLVQFYRLRSGEILIDDNPLRTINTHWIRTNITLIQQASILFNETFLMNVALGHPHPSQVTRSEVKDACESALLQSTISSLPDGIDTRLGSGGASLSGGQMQRLALARAKLRDPPILILDEVTSGLDRASSTLAMEAIRVWRRGKTTIIITHDVSQIESGDLVYVMDQGKVVQTGLRKEVEAEKGGIFSDLVQSSGGSESAIESTQKPTTPDKKEEESIKLQPDVFAKASVSRRGSLLASVFPREQSGRSRRRSHRASLGAGHNYGTLVKNTWQQQNQPEPRSSYMPDERAIEPEESILSERMLVEDDAEEARIALSPEVQIRMDLDFLKNNGANVQKGRGSMRSFRTQSNATVASTSHTQNIPQKVPKKPLSLVFGPSRGEEPSASKKAEDKELSLIDIYKTVWPNLGFGDRIKLVLALLSTVTIGLATPAFSFLFAGLLTTFSLPADIRGSEAKKWAGLLALVVAIEGVATFYSNYLFESVAQSWVDNLRVESLKRILVQPKEWHAQVINSKERLSSTLDRNGEEMRNLLGRSANGIIAAVVMGLVSVCWAMVVSWKLTLVTVAAGPIVLISSQLYAFISTKYETLCEQSDLDTASILAEVVSNIRVVRTLTLERYFTKIYADSSHQSYTSGIKLALYSGPLYGASDSMTTFLTALVFYYGMLLLTRNEFTLSDIIQAINLLIFSIGSASSLLQDIPQISASRVAAGQLLRLSSLPRYASFEQKGSIRVQTPLPVRMRDVQFFYPNHPQSNVLRGVNLVIESGETVAIVGSSGCGKSTIASLLLRLYSPSIMDPIPPTPLWQKPSSYLRKPSPLTYSGVPADRLDTAHLRTMISYVPQHPHLFPLTLAENIAYGLPDRSRFRNIEQIIRAAQRAGIHQLALSLPQGYRTQVGDGGVLLSGGQTQRVGIARALLRLSGVSNGLVIMDEPTAALDANGAQEVRETLRSLVEDNRCTANESGLPGGDGGLGGHREDSPGRGLTLVLITHSREMMKMADRILVMDHGVVVEEGEYHELLARGHSALGSTIGDETLEPVSVKKSALAANGSHNSQRSRDIGNLSGVETERRSVGGRGGSDGETRWEGTRGYAPGISRPDSVHNGGFI